ncbi:MAG: hybrid sensor histidine kinase/response regulator, partial [Bacteroidota bacterium]
LLKTLKEEPEFSGIPFVFLTGNNGPGDMRKGMLLGADDYLTKPFTADELLAAVETRLTKRRTMQKYIESQFDEIKSNIVHSLPHEFRTPLNGILGFSQILIEEENIPPKEVKEIGTMILRSGKRLHHLLENLVLFGQMQLWMNDQKKIAGLRQESTTLQEVVRNVAEQLSAHYERPVDLHIAVKESSVQISSLYLTTILEEIVDNALKFSEKGSPVQLSSGEFGPNLCITVRDEGRGMSEEQIKNISGFRQFERRYYEQQGAGLGLSIATTLAELHGGTLSIKSKGNGGTTVSIIIPLALKN